MQRMTNKNNNMMCPSEDKKYSELYSKPSVTAGLEYYTWVQDNIVIRSLIPKQANAEQGKHTVFVTMTISDHATDDEECNHKWTFSISTKCKTVNKDIQIELINEAVIDERNCPLHRTTCTLARVCEFCIENDDKFPNGGYPVCFCEYELCVCEDEGSCDCKEKPCYTKDEACKCEECDCIITCDHYDHTFTVAMRYDTWMERDCSNFPEVFMV